MNDMEETAERLRAADQLDEVVGTELRGLWRHGIDRVENADLRS